MHSSYRLLDGPKRSQEVQAPLEFQSLLLINRLTLRHFHTHRIAKKYFSFLQRASLFSSKIPEALNITSWFSLATPFLIFVNLLFCCLIAMKLTTANSYEPILTMVKSRHLLKHSRQAKVMFISAHLNYIKQNFSEKLQ